jgi:nucleotide-binding universal stress UspA family protein
MKTILIPVDFTETSDNAVNFATAWSRQYGYERIILLKSFYDSMFESVVISAEYSNFNQENLNREREVAVERLHQLCRGLAAKTHPQVKVITAVSEAPLLRAIMELIDREKPELIVVGSDNFSYSSESFVASNVIAIAKVSPVRVLVVPASYTYQPVMEALVPCDYDFLATVNKVNNLRSTPQWQEVTLNILNVDAKERYLNPDDIFRERETRLHEYLKNFRYQLYYRNERNIISGIKNFISDHPVQLIIALPGKHSFLYALTHKSITEAIYRNANQPVLILK